MPIRHFNVVAINSRAERSDRRERSRSARLIAILALFLSACTSQPAVSPSSPQKISEARPVQPALQATATATPGPLVAHIGDSVPAALRKQFAGRTVRLDISSSLIPNDRSKKIQWVYALVAPFPTVRDGVTLDDLQRAWSQGSAAAPAPFTGTPLLMEESTLATFTALWDEPAAGAVRV